MYAKGQYPKTKVIVQHVAKWQNDGNDTGISPAMFVEWAEATNQAWKRVVFDSAYRFAQGSLVKGGARGAMYLTGQRNSNALEAIGERIAKDIGVACDRIDTGRLKKSFSYRIKNK